MKSDINEVQRLANKYGIGKINLSTRKDKKYMVVINNKKIHFGDPNYADFTGHKDVKRREQFRTRNAKWANQPKDTAGFLSYHLLWS